jgi:hypothetical protein
MMLLIWPFNDCLKKADWHVMMLGVVVAITFGYGKKLVEDLICTRTKYGNHPSFHRL